MSALAAELRDLVVEDARGRRIVDGVSLRLREGRTLAVVGASGSGKTTLALALLGHLRPGLRRVSGQAQIAGEELLGCPDARLRELRRGRIAYVPQDPPTSLCPTLTIERMVADVVRREPGRDVEYCVREALAQASLPVDRGLRQRYPHELSGGQQQRVAIAVALAARPRVLVLDEPTTGLDVVTQAAILAELDELRSGGLTLVLVSHDLAVVAAHADEIAVMESGRIVELQSRSAILAAPRHARTRALMATRTLPDRSVPRGSTRPALEVSGLTAAHHGATGTVAAAREVSFSIAAGECLALVGSSGCGKTTIARCVTGLHPPEAGTIVLEGEPLAAVARKRSRGQRGRMAVVFQNPYDSLNPRRRVREIVARPLRLHEVVPRAQIAAEVALLLARVELEPALAERQPAQLSGGERQRVAIARALATRPSVLICDEVTSSLDATVQASVLDLLARLRDELGLALLVISHDMTLVAQLATRILVLDGGEVVEQGPARRLLQSPASAVGQALRAATLPAVDDDG